MIIQTVRSETFQNLANPHDISEPPVLLTKEALPPVQTGNAQRDKCCTNVRTSSASRADLHWESGLLERRNTWMSEVKSSSWHCGLCSLVVYTADCYYSNTVPCLD